MATRAFLQTTEITEDTIIKQYKTYKKLLEMGFGETICVQAACKYPNQLDKATSYILEHDPNPTAQKQLPLINIHKTNETSPLTQKQFITHVKSKIANKQQTTENAPKDNNEQFLLPVNNRRYDTTIMEEIERKQSELLSNIKETRQRLEKLASLSDMDLDELVNNKPKPIYITSPSQLTNNKFEDKYEILKRTGSPGSFGVVYQAKRISDGELFAVKEISKSKIYRLQRSDKMRQTLVEFMESEITVMKEVQHTCRYIVKFFETYETKDAVYIVMELCKGGELLKFINKQYSGRCKEKDCKRIIKQICEALFYIHDKHKVIHCDLKPDNILFADENMSHIKIVDFGLSKVLPRLQESLSQLCGTPYYTAPEVIRGKYSHECDMWSVGVIAYLMIFGSHPFYVHQNENEYFGINLTQAIYDLILKGFDPTVKGGYGAWFPKSLIKADVLSKNGRDFIGGLLETKVSKRLTAREALQHPWFNCNDDDYCAELTITHSNSLKVEDLNATPFANFAISHKFKYAISGLFHEHYKNMRPIHFENLKQLFKELDKNGSGKISYAEFKEGMLKCKGLKLNEKKIKHIFNELDMDKHGEIAFENLLDAAVYDYLIASDERLYEAFHDLDVDDDGTISLDLLKDKIHDMNIYDNVDAVLSIIDEVDVNNDNTINYQEFLRALHPDFNETPNWFWTANVTEVTDEIKDEIKDEIEHEINLSNISKEIVRNSIIQEDDLAKIERKLKKHLKIKDRLWLLKEYKQCFVGDECVKVMIDLQFAQTEQHAIRIGNKLIDANIIRHVTNDHRFENAYYFYNFVIDSEDMHESMNEVSDTSTYLTDDELNELQEKGGKLKEYLDIKDRKWHFKTYPKCFVGNECVKRMIKWKFTQTEQEAVRFGNKLIDANIIRHVTTGHRFENKYYFYNFVVDFEDIHAIIIKTGWMEKQGKWNKSWKKRHFKLQKNGIMRYYRNENDKKSAGTFDVTTLTKLECKSWDSEKPYGIRLCTPLREWKFVCEDEKEQENWLMKITEVYNLKHNAGDFSKAVPNDNNFDNDNLLKGWMKKEGRLANSLLERKYFKLQRDGKMKYYHDENDTYAIATFNVKKATKLLPYQKAWNEYGIAVYTPHRNWKLLCQNDEERNDWIHAMESVKITGE